MINPSKLLNNIISIIFILILFVGFCFNDPIKYVESLSSCLSQRDGASADSISFSSIENDFTSGIYLKHDLVDIGGLFTGALGMRGFSSDRNIYISDGNYIISASPYASADYEFEQINRLNRFLSENGIQLMYVNLPAKYTDDSVMFFDFGIETYSNQNADTLIAKLKEADINTLDLREYIKDGTDIKDLFYRTDHHWTTKGALWGTKIIMEHLSDICGFNLDSSIYNIENYDVREWKNCWLGEQGRYVARTRVGLDDYSEIKPRFATSYSFIEEDGSVTEGTFDDFISEWTYDTNNSVYDNRSWHYSYGLKHCINNNVKNGKILVIGDSFNQVTEPFISLGVHETDWILMRLKDDSFDLKSYILENGFDAVVICYCQSLIGGHDDVSSGNDNMYSFGL